MSQGGMRRILPLAVSVLGFAACANSGKSQQQDTFVPPSSSSGAASSGSSSGGPSSTTGMTPGDTSGPAFAVPDSGHAPDSACQHFDVQFLPRIPIVSVLVDRSGSMFQPISGGDGGMVDEWDPLRTATLGVIQNLQSEVAFGFAAYTGINPNTQPGMCPILNSVPVAMNNFSAISAVYGMLGQPTFKAETPAQLSLDAVSQSLTLAASQFDAGTVGQAGNKYILFVTDGETDFCDDGSPVCPADAVIAELQKLSSQGIQTLIMGIGSNLSNISVPVLQSFANAGAGLPALAPPSSASGPPLQPTDIYNQCNSVTGWKQLFTTAGLSAGQALGTYGTAPTTNATVYSPDATNIADLSDKISTALSTVKSCSFDLQGKIKVDLANASEGSVTIDGTAIPFDATNGWTMPTATELDLVGSACASWRATGKNIAFDFPCEVLITVAQ